MFDLKNKNILSGLAPRKWLFIYLLLLSLYNLFLHSPTLDVPFRKDSTGFIYDTNQVRELGPLLSYTYSWNRTRKYGPGDTLLFRPLLFGLLSLEKYYFGNNFLAWHLTAYLFFMLLVFNFFFFLYRYNHQIHLSFLLTLFFSSLTSNIELATWEHLTGYLICFSLILLAVRNLTDFLNNGHRTALYRYALFTLLAALFYEAGILLALSGLLAYAILKWRNKLQYQQSWFTFALLLFPLLVYYLLFTIDLYRFMASEQTNFNAALRIGPGLLSDALTWRMIMATLLDSLQFGRLFIQFTLLPLFEEWDSYKAGFANFGLADSGWLATIAAALGAYAVIIRHTFSLRRLKENQTTLLLLGLLLGMYLGFITFFKFSIYQKELLTTGRFFDNHYICFFGVLFTLALSFAADERRFFALSKNLRLVVALAVMLLVSINSYTSYLHSQRINNSNQKLAIANNNIKKFIEKHRHEPDFSFGFVEDSPLLKWELRFSYHEEGVMLLKKVNIFEIFYPDYYNPLAPRYRLR